MEEEERIVRGDDVIVELDATLEDLYMGGSLKVQPSTKIILVKWNRTLYLLMRSIQH